MRACLLLSAMSDPREAELLQALQAREEELARVNEELAAQKEIMRLRESLDALSRRFFDKRSEQLDPRQLELLLRLSGNELGKADAASEKEVALLLPPPASAVPRSRKARAPRLPENLPVIEETIVPALVQAAPQAYRRIGEEASLSRRDVTPLTRRGRRRRGGGKLHAETRTQAPRRSTVRAQPRRWRRHLLRREPPAIIPLSKCAAIARPRACPPRAFRRRVSSSARSRGVRR